MPDQDAVIAITAETADMQNEINLVWDYLLPTIKTNKLAENSALVETLKQKLSSLALPLAEPGNVSAIASQISGKTFFLEPNEKRLETMKLLFTDNSCKVTMKIDSVSYDFSFGTGKWITVETTLPGPDLLLPAKAHFVGLPPARVAGTCGWKDDKTLELVLRYIESPHTENISCRFDKSKVSLGFHYSNGAINPPEITGVTRD
jgi:hypothetical protein